MGFPNELHQQAHLDLFEALEASPELKTMAEGILLSEQEQGALLGWDHLGFLGTYKLLAQLVPQGRVVYDLGCSNAFQSWFFRDHRGYVGVDRSVTTNLRFSLPGHQHFHGTIEEFIEVLRRRGDGPDLDPRHFGILNYVDGIGGMGLKQVKTTFGDCYVFYPKAGDHAEHSNLPWEKRP